MYRNLVPFLTHSIYIWILDFGIAGGQGRIIAERAAAADNVKVES